MGNGAVGLLFFINHVNTLLVDLGDVALVFELDVIEHGANGFSSTLGYFLSFTESKNTWACT